MQLDQLVHWRLQGEPDVFTETRDGEEWQVIHSGGAAHWAGFSQLVEFPRSAWSVSVSAEAMLYTTGGGLMIRIGIDPESGDNPQASSIIWGPWEGPDNFWDGARPRRVGLVPVYVGTNRIAVFLESKARWPVRVNTSRWRDVQLEVEYVGVDPEPPPDPDPEPDPDLGIPGQIAQALAENRETLERISGLLDQWGKAQEWVDEYNENKHNDHY